MNLIDTPEPPVKRNRDLPPAKALEESTARALARTGSLPSCTARSLEERRLIHRQDSVRVQADAFRDLRTRLLALGGNQNFVTLVVPVGHGSGGSFVARNLALAFAFDDARSALLVDCDSLHPSQHTALGVTVSDGGLMDYLGEGTAELQAIQYPTGIPRLDLIPNGSTHEISGEYFSSYRARTLIDSLRSANPNRYIILDGPSVLNSPDARILSDLADLVVLVAGYGKATIEGIERAAANFDPAKFAGVVFNDLR